MLELTLALIGAAMVMVGWHWAGVTDRRTTAVATGIPAVILLGATVFSAAAGHLPSTAMWIFAGTMAVWAALFAASSHWELMTERTTGLYSLFVILVSALAFAPIARVSAVLGIGDLLVLIAAAFIFISGGLTPRIRGFRMFVGWLTLACGALATIAAFIPAFGLSIGGF
ncbi:MAG: hypothetical protein ACREOV_07140 [Candidatus Dormibacteraceae bacterium]